MNNKTKFLVVALIMLFVIACGSAKSLIFHGHSMEPSIVDGQKIFSNPVNLKDLKRGDLVYYIEFTGKENVKRLIGLPGETVEVKDGIVYINGTALDEPYVMEPATYKLNVLSLKSNEYFVLGDNRNESSDSHNFGPITGDSIKGIIIQN